MNELYEIGGSQFGGWFFVLVGLFEVLIGIALFIPRTRMLGGMGLAFVMLGAVVLNIGFVAETLPADADDPGMFVPVNLVLAALGATIAFLSGRIGPSRTATQTAI